MTTVRYTSRGPDVYLLEELLVELGHDLYVSTFFGVDTDRAVRAFQRRSRLVVDGIVGPKTWSVLIAERPIDRHNDKLLSEADLELARDAGVAVGFGTDLLGETHEQQSREFRIRAQVLTPLEILQSATLVNARILGREGELGVLEVGALADLLVVDGNPLDDLSLLEEQGKHLALVMKGGEPLVNRLD